MLNDTFGQRFGVPLHPPVRRSLGVTGETTPGECTPTGTRISQEQGEYTPLACPTGPDCYDVIDAKTGAVIIKDIKGLIGGSQVNHRAVGACLTHGYTYGQAAVQQPEAAPEQTVVQPAPTTPPPSGEGTIPISIDIQAFTPSYWEAMQRGQPLPLSRPGQPMPAQPEPAAPAPKLVQKELPKSDLATVGIAAGLVAAGAFALSFLK